MRCWGPASGCKNPYVTEPVFLVGDLFRAPRFICAQCQVKLAPLGVEFLSFPERRRVVRERVAV